MKNLPAAVGLSILGQAAEFWLRLPQALAGCVTHLQAHVGASEIINLSTTSETCPNAIN
jgi:hypothetical protein